MTSENIKRVRLSKIIEYKLCGSRAIAEKNLKRLDSKNITKYIYYGCTRLKGINCKCGHIREKDLINQLSNLMNNLPIDETLIKQNGLRSPAI